VHRTAEDVALAVDAGLTRERDETRKVVATTVRQRTVPRLGVFALGVMVLVAPMRIGPTQAEEPANGIAAPPSVPKILWFSLSGLDGDNNELDAILAASGHFCFHHTRYDLDKLGECLVERSFTDFLRKLPPHQPEISRKLRSLGALCRTIRHHLTCVYRARQNYKALEGAVLLIDEDRPFTVHFEVVNRDGKLEYATSVDQKVTLVYEKNDRFLKTQ
jgi:hypothetical protein